MTLRVHPRFGEEMALIARRGRDEVWVEFDDGRRAFLPVQWTSLHPRPAPLEWRGEAVRLDPDTLREVAAWVAVRGVDRVFGGERELAPQQVLGEEEEDDGGCPAGCDERVGSVVGQAGSSDPHQGGRGGGR